MCKVVSPPRGTEGVTKYDRITGLTNGLKRVYVNTRSILRDYSTLKFVPCPICFALLGAIEIGLTLLGIMV